MRLDNVGRVVIRFVVFFVFFFFFLSSSSSSSSSVDNGESDGLKEREGCLRGIMGRKRGMGKEREG